MATSAEILDENQLTPEQVDELRTAFALFDEKDTGWISIKSLVSAMKAFGVKPSDEELKKMIAEIDKDGKGVVNFEEFRQVVQHRVTDSVLDSEVREAFEMFDLDGDEYLSADDLKGAMLHLGEQLTDSEAQAMMRMATDCSGEGEERKGESSWDGRIDLAQFRRMMRLRAEREIDS